MSIAINLLPDIRQAKLRARRRKQLATGIAITVWVVCGGLVGLMTIYELGQKTVIAAFRNEVQNKKTELQNMSGLIDALTAQQHSVSLTTLYDRRVYVTRFIKAYSEANPSGVVLTALAVDEQNQLAVTGTSPSYAAVAKLARALEASNVKVGEGAAETNQPYFSSVTIMAANSTDGKGVNFTINATLAGGVTNASK